MSDYASVALLSMASADVLAALEPDDASIVVAELGRLQEKEGAARLIPSTGGFRAVELASGYVAVCRPLSDDEAAGVGVDAPASAYLVAALEAPGSLGAAAVLVTTF